MNPNKDLESKLDKLFLQMPCHSRQEVSRFTNLGFRAPSNRVLRQHIQVQGLFSSMLFVL